MNPDEEDQDWSKYTKLTGKEKAAIRRLWKLADYWPKSLRLWSAAGSLLVVHEETGEILADLGDLIPNDGGDPNVEEDERGVQFILVP